MAARKRPLSEPKLEEMRRRIQATKIIEKMQAHVFGTEEMSATQIRAAEALLRKSMPDLSSIDLQAEMEHSGGITVNIKHF